MLKYLYMHVSVYVVHIFYMWMVNAKNRCAKCEVQNKTGHFSRRMNLLIEQARKWR